MTDLLPQLEMLRDALQGISLTEPQFRELLKALPDIRLALGWPTEEDEKKQKEKEEKAKRRKQISAERKKDGHSWTFCITYKGQLYFIQRSVEEIFHKWEYGIEEFLKTYEECVEEYDEEADGDKEQYKDKSVGSWDSNI